MELTIEQALQQAIEAHRAGKLQDAEGLYKAILSAQPKHPDENHNLGVLAVSLDKTELALPLFKTALEANPNQGQFWLSYIDALMKTNQLDNAKSVLEQGRKLGLSGDKVDSLQAQLTQITSRQDSELLLEKQGATFTQQRKRFSSKKEKRKGSQIDQTNPNQLIKPSKTEIDALLDHYQAGRYELVQNLAKSITQQYPTYPFGWKVLGATFKQTGKIQDALIANRRAVELSPNDAEAYSNLGITLQDLGKPEDAVACYRAAISIRSNYAEANNNLGISLRELGKLEDAEACYRAAIAIKPDYAEAHSNLGITLQELGRQEEAEKSCKEAIVIMPSLAAAHYNLGNILKDSGKLEDAKKSYRLAIAIKPDYAEAYSNLGTTLYELGELDDAAATYRTAIAMRPDYAEAHSNFGNTLKALGKLEEAESCYRVAIALRPELAYAHYNLGNILNDLGKLKDAEKCYGTAIALRPDYAEAHSNLGNTLKDLGNLEDAEKCYRLAIVIKPDYAEAHSNLGITLQELGRQEDAESCYKNAISLNPDYELAQYNYGVWFCEQGNYKQAAEQLLRIKHFRNSQNYLLKCWYFLNEQALFYDQLHSLIRLGECNAIVGAFSCRAAVRFGTVTANPFCNEPLRYVLKTDLSQEYDFPETFVQPALAILNDRKILNRTQHLLSNGRQTAGNLFALENIFVNEIKRIIGLEIEKYRACFKDSEEGLIKHWPDSYSLHGWIISMKNGGKLSPHMHEKGWISGSIYINVPPKAEPNSGDLVTCIEDEKYLTESNKNKSTSIDVATGSLCLFPASLLHYTIPFASDEDRIVLAFDVIPGRGPKS